MCVQKHAMAQFSDAVVLGAAAVVAVVVVDNGGCTVAVEGKEGDNGRITGCCATTWARSLPLLLLLRVSMEGEGEREERSIGS